MTSAQRLAAHPVRGLVAAACALAIALAGATGAAAAPAHQARRQATGDVVGMSWASFTIRTGGKRM